MAQTGALRRRVDALLGGATSGWRSVETGHSGAGRYLVEGRNGERCFVKVGTTPWSAGAVRREAELYAALPRSFVPTMITRPCRNARASADALARDPVHTLPPVRMRSAGCGSMEHAAAPKASAKAMVKARCVFILCFSESLQRDVMCATRSKGDMARCRCPKSHPAVA